MKVVIKEQELITRLKARDTAAMSYLYDNYAGALYGMILRVLKKEELAEEVLQDVFLRFWDKIDLYDSAKGRLFTWMANIARNLAIDKTRAKEYSQIKKTEALENYVDSERTSSYEQRTDEIGLRELLSELPEERRWVVEYLYFRGYSQSELAEEFNIPLGTVKTRLRLAMEQLRITLEIK